MLFRPLSLLGLLAAMVLCTITGCKEKPASAAAQPPPPAEVSVVRVAPATQPVVFSEIGQTAASRRVEIRARIKGYIQKRFFEEGSRVREGEQLYQIDAREFEVALSRAEAALMRAQANLELAERDVARLAPLVEQQSISRKELDDAETRRKVAIGDVALNRAEINQAKLNLSYTRIDSPVSGIIGLTRKQEGSFVDDFNNSLLTEALKFDPIHVNFSIPERTMLRYRNDVLSGRIKIPEGDNWQVLIELLDGSVYEKSGRLTIIGFEVNQTTGTALFRAEVPNPTGQLIDGQFVRVRLLGAVRPNVVAVPQRAVQMGDQGAFVYVVGTDDKVQIRPVKEGEWSPPNWIINEGLAAGDRVVVDGVQKLTPGATVKVSGEIALPSPSTQPRPVSVGAATP